MQEIKGLVSAAAGGTGATVSFLSTLGTVVQIVSGVLAAIASGFAIYFYVRKFKERK